MKMLLFLLCFLIFGFTTAFAQEVPEEYYTQFQLFENKVSNDQITLSVEKTSYLPGDIVKIVGFVDNSGAIPDVNRIFIWAITSQGIGVFETSAVPTRIGEFQIQQEIPLESLPGKYDLYAKYGEEGKEVVMKITLTGVTKTAVVSIPIQSNDELKGLNFEPKLTKIDSSTKLVWINDDTVVHTVVSGRLGVNNIMFTDGKFDSGIISPGNKFETFLEEGKYSYFCRLYPWLRGEIIVSKSDSPIPPQSDDTPSVESIIDTQDSIGHTLINDPEDSKLWSITNCSNCTSAVLTSSDKKDGLSSLHFSVKGDQNAEGERATFDLTFEPFDITDWEAIETWIKTSGSVFADFQFAIIDSNNKSRTLAGFNSNSFPEWNNVNIQTEEFISEDEGFNSTSVIGFSVRSPLGTDMKQKQLDIFLDDIKWIKPTTQDISDLERTQFLTVSTEKDNYSVPEKILVSGKVASSEFDQPVTAQVFNPKQELIQVEQIIPDSANEFHFDISTLGERFQKEGDYEIIVQYGIFKYTAQTGFSISPLETKEQYKGYDIYEINKKFYAIPDQEGEFEIDRLVIDNNEIFNKPEDGYSIFINGTSVDDIKTKIDDNPAGPYFIQEFKDHRIVRFGETFYATLSIEGDFDIDRFENGNYTSTFSASSLQTLQNIMNESIEPPFPVSDDVLLQIWVESPELRSDFPEAEDGNYDNLKEWAKTIGWNVDERLSVLIPEGQTPEYLALPSLDEPQFLVTDPVLLQIWVERPDLQSSFPEVEQGNFDAIRNWAETVGWNEDERLAVLIPEGETPQYLQPATTPEEDYSGFLVIVLIAIGGVAVYFFVIRNQKFIKQSKTS